MSTTKIFLFNNGGPMGWMSGVALGEDGKFSTAHVSSHEGYMRHDLGLTSDWKHDKYNAAYPDGWELVDLIDLDAAGLDAHDGLQAAIEMHRLVAEDAAITNSESPSVITAEGTGKQ